MNLRAITEFLKAVHSREAVNGLTHGFYRYPARFSPLFARAAIQEFSQPGDVILDPFMGGGTTLVEARALGRRAIGVDINALAVFVATVKTRLLSEREIAEVRLWIEDLADNVRLHQSVSQMNSNTEQDYPPNLSDKMTWRIRKILRLALGQMSELSGKQQGFARCVLLRTAQWALDCRMEIPNTQQFRQQLLGNLEEMASGAREYTKAVRKAERSYDLRGSVKIVCLHRSVVGLEEDHRLNSTPAPALILTSPPYPGVHVLYHAGKYKAVEKHLPLSGLQTRWMEAARVFTLLEIENRRALLPITRKPWQPSHHLPRLLTNEPSFYRWSHFLIRLGSFQSISLQWGKRVSGK